MTVKDPLVGKFFGGYRITERIAHGGMAAVYRGVDRRLGRDVAIKLVLGGKQFSDVFLKRFRREIRTLGGLIHPNIVPLLDFGSIHGVPYLVMPFVGGGTLQDDITKGKVWNWYDAAQLLIPIAKALSYAHSKGIIHRDVKPGNILITDRGDPMLSDFGLMKMLKLEQSADLTGDGMVGTPDYMSPEQWVGEVVPQTDMYALGIVFYIMVTGHLPYEAKTAPEIMFKHISESHIRPRKYTPDLPLEVELFIEKALKKDSKKRFASMEEFVFELQRICEAVRLREHINNSRSMSKQPAAFRKVKWMDFKVRLRSLPVWVWAGGVFFLLSLIIVFAIFMVSQNFIGLQNQLATAQATQRASLLDPVGVGTLEQVSQESTKIARSTIRQVEAGSDSTPTVEATEDIDVFSVGSSQVSEMDGMKLMYVPEGIFMMGGLEENRDVQDDEKPQHEVYLDAFWMDQTEVSIEMYQKCVEDGVCSEPSRIDSQSRGFYYGNEEYLNYPVVNVNWYQSSEYCYWAGRRLPTEAEWEKAAASFEENSNYPWGNRLDCSLANYYQSASGCVGDTVAVDALPNGASYYGVLGAAGNVWEWVSDWYSDDYYVISPYENPMGPDIGAYNVIRGGAFDYEAKRLRITNRGLGGPGNSNFDGGFRCAMDASSP